MGGRPHKRVSAEELRRRFNDGKYWERAQSGEFTERVVREDEASPRARKRINLPHGTLSQILSYDDPQGRRVALVHQYLRPDGTLGASGKPDPKWVRADGVIYAPELK